ncbi:TRAP transporter large permease subunit [Salmonella enterica subsp. enterica serovar Weltevreden]|nr:TRAP transporter large permease subunit [Salmonella enterica subsp. enterica serovar Weltevreden]
MIDLFCVLYANCRLCCFTGMGAPIGICIVIASFSTMMLVLPFDISMFATAQKMFSSTDSFALLAVPFFSFVGVIVNSGIAARLVRQTVLLANCPARSLIYQHRRQYMMFGANFGSALPPQHSIGGVMRFTPDDAREEFDNRGFAAAVNIASRRREC